MDADSTRPDTADETQEWYCHLREFFVGGDGDTMARYIVMIGDEHVAADRDFLSPEAQEILYGCLPPMPLHMDGYQESSSAYPRGFVGPILPLNRALEFLIGESIDNTQKMNSIRKLLLPYSNGMNVRMLKQYKKDPIAFYQPDMLSPSAGPFMVEPPNLSQSYGPMINMLGVLLDSVSGQGPLFSGQMPNRADSAVAAMAAGEFNDVPLTSAAELADDAWSGTWRACIFHVKTQLDRNLNGNAPTEAFLKLGRIDETVLGLDFDQESGQVSLSDAEIPDPHELDLTIRNKNPRPKQQVYTDLKERLANGELDQVEFEIALIKEGLDTTIVSRVNYNNYESAWIENVVLFGDGQKPGRVIANEFADNHSIHWLVHMEVMSSHVFKSASDEVQTAFIAHARDYHRSGLRNMTEQALAVNEFGQMGPPAPEAAGQMGMSPQQMLPAGQGGY
jgi:hypothetical protein